LSIPENGGATTNTIRYFSFGSTRATTGTLPTDKKFTGQRLDATDLYYYGARYYDATIGRFISPDTVVQDYTNPQTLNRYSYCVNNPLKYVDPTGHFVDWIFDLATIIFDAGQMATNPSWENAAMLVSDLILGIFPFVPAGMGPLTKSIKFSAEVADSTNDALKWLVKTRNYAQDVARGARKTIRTGTLGAKSTRIWYLDQLKTIPGLIDKTLPLQQQSRQAFELRNAFKAEARNLMNNWQYAEILDNLEPAKSWTQMIQRAIEKGNKGDNIYQYIIDASQRSDPNVNRLFGLTGY
jgi:RHS repeat-associated protein